MVNSLKSSAGGTALQVTKSAREAGLVQEDAEGDAIHLAGVYVYGFDGLLLVVDAQRVSSVHRSHMVTIAASRSESIYRGEAASVEIAGNGYQVQLPGCKAAGFEVGDDGHVVSADGVIVIHDGGQFDIADELVGIRRDQAHD